MIEPNTPPPRMIAFQQVSDRPIWCAWEYRDVKGKPRKVPIHPDGSNFSTSRDQPYTLDEVRGVGSGAGLVLTDRVKIDGKTLVGFDCDACRDPDTGALMPWAERLRKNHGNTYTEVTPSGQGIRLLALVENPPEHELHKVRSLDPADNTTKRPEIETFGLGRACYITVSGDLLPGSSPDIETAKSLDWFTTQHPSAAGGLLGEIPELPTGAGAAPTFESVDASVRAHPEGRALADGQWEAVLPTESASEGYWRLVQRVVRAAHGHGDIAVRYLIEHTAFGAGTVDSAEPDRYRREDWVAGEVARIATKAPRSDANVFDQPYRESSHMPTEADLERRQAAHVQHQAGRMQQLGAFIDDAIGVEWLVDDLVPKEGLVSIFAKPGQGKTPVMLRLGLATAAGWPTFFGRQMEHHGPVVYFIGEDEAGIRDRSVGQIEAMQDEALEDLRDASSLDTHKIPFYVTREPGRISDPDNVGGWISTIKDILGDKKPSAVFLDTLARNFGSGNESSTEDMQKFVDGCDALKREFSCVIIAAHHPSKSNENEGRGSGVLQGALEGAFKIELEQRTRLVLTPTKIKNGPIPEEPLVGKLVPVVVGTKKDGTTPRTAITLVDTPPDPAVAFKEISTDQGSIRILEAIGALGGQPTSLAALAKEAGVSSVKALRDRIAKLKDANMVDIVAGKGNGGTKYHLLAEGTKTLSRLQND